MQAYSGMDGRRAVHRPVLHRGHGFHAHGLSAAGRALHLDGNGLERLEAAEESAAQGTAVEKIPAKAGETLLLFNPSDIDFAESASGRTALSVRGEEYACALTLEELSVRLERLRLFSLPPLLPCEHAEGTGGGALDAQQLRAAAGERAGIRCAAQQGPH